MNDSNDVGGDPEGATAPLSRREVGRALLLGGTSLVMGCAAPLTHSPSSLPGDAPMSELLSLAGRHVVAPLPFDPGALNGLSRRLIESHHENNYGGAVRNLNRTELELASITADTPPLVVAALRDRELVYRNSMVLHEAYFGNLGGSGRRSSALESAIATAYGTVARWEQHFLASAAGLAGGSGWVVLAYELDSGALRTIGSGGHPQALAHAVPLLVLDMYEHSYHLDFGAQAARYVEAFVDNVDWDAVEQRLVRARAARAALFGDSRG